MNHLLLLSLSSFRCLSGSVFIYRPCFLASKSKTQRFKSKKRAAILKQRSKSVERPEPGCVELNNDFEEKLREWSVKQGHHPDYYISARRSIG